MGSHPPGVVSATHFPALGSCPAAGHLDAVTVPGYPLSAKRKTRNNASYLLCFFRSDHHGLRCDTGDPRDGWRFHPGGREQRKIREDPSKWSPSSMGGLRETPLYPHNNPPSLPLRTAGAHPICTGNTTQPPPLTASCLRLKAFPQSPLSFTTSLKGPPPPALFPRSQQPSAGP